ncbi:MAG: SAM-dependent methyltransferase [Planctomycetes bacterium]|nr:SAM-dependent methyltransferase [Planctomycetota bacterium]MBU4400919.1 SAM-dependent methyltransferase [Planctomycetota bacterium]
MNSPKARSIATADKTPTPEELLRRFGARAALAREGVCTLFDALGSDGRSAFSRWKILFGRWAGRAAEKPPRRLDRLAARYGVSAGSGDPAALLFALQTYYALLVEGVAERFAPGADAELLPDNPFSWCAAVRSRSVGRWIGRLRAEIARSASNATSPDGPCDMFKPLYQNLFPRPLRHQLGEYYTPDWLAQHVLDRVGYTGDPAARLLDPACGSGTFLVMALRRLRKNDERRMMNDELRHAPNNHHSSFIIHNFPVVGFDLNPLAVLTARANFLLAVADLLPDAGRVEIPVYLRNSILDESDGPSGGGEQFDFVVGNPPWIAWDNLSEEDRRATKPLWERYGLFSLSGNEARHGGGKKDLSMLMLYAAADKYLKTDGRLGMVLTQTVFQTIGAGDGFRRFRLGPDGPPLKVLRVDDMTALRPFDDAANRTSTIVLQKGAVTQYPVPYVKWKERREKRGEKREGWALQCPVDCPVNQDECLARPIDPAKPTSPWLVLEKNGGKPLAVSQSGAAYTAHLGANSGGANGVYWLEVLGQSDDGVLIRNLAAKGKHRIETVEAAIEPDLLYPLLRWGDVARYRTEPRCRILLAQDPDRRSGIDEKLMRERYPRTLDYLERFRDLLVSRASYRRYQRRGPFYSMYNVGPYTVAPVKVVWRRMDRRINAAVVESSRKRPPVPQETCVLVACDRSDEAHYLCAMLNSTPMGELVSAHSVRGGKGFGTPGMLDFLPLGRFDPSDPRHVELASLSRRAHTALLPLPLGEGWGEGRREEAASVAELQRRMDGLAGGL